MVFGRFLRVTLLGSNGRELTLPGVNKTLWLRAKNGGLQDRREHSRDIGGRIAPLYAFLIASG